MGHTKRAKSEFLSLQGHMMKLAPIHFIQVFLEIMKMCLHFLYHA